MTIIELFSINNVIMLCFVGSISIGVTCLYVHCYFHVVGG